MDRMSGGDVYPGGAFHRIGKTHASQSSVPRVANIVRDVSRVSWIVFRFFLPHTRRTVISTAESS